MLRYLLADEGGDAANEERRFTNRRYFSSVSQPRERSPLPGFANASINPKNFFAELKRRNVYKVAIAYAVIAWLAIQVAATVVPALLLPGVITSAVVFVAVLGFPVALVLAWAFELTPEGIRRTGEFGPNESVPRRTGRKVAALIVIAAIAATGLFAWQLFRKNATSGADKSIAVLPFQNFRTIRRTPTSPMACRMKF